MMRCLSTWHPRFGKREREKKTQQLRIVLLLAHDDRFHNLDERQPESFLLVELRPAFPIGRGHDEVASHVAHILGVWTE